MAPSQGNWLKDAISRVRQSTPTKQQIDPGLPLAFQLVEELRLTADKLFIPSQNKAATDMIDHVCGRFVLRWDEEFVGRQAQFLYQLESQRQAGIYLLFCWR